MECYNLIQKKDIILNKLILIYIHLNHKNNLIKNLILYKELYQEKEHLEQLKNVKVKQIINIMQLNMLNNQKDKLILLNYKLDNKLKILNLNILLNVMIFIFGHIKENQIIFNKILLQLKWIQQKLIQNKLFRKGLKIMKFLIQLKFIFNQKKLLKYYMI